jgi:hypothetical protein
MKVGDYVRTPLGITKYIGKYDNYEDFYEFDKLDEELWTGDIANVVYSFEIDNIVLKSSPNIIDLIEVGDYVNGNKVLDREDYLLWVFDNEEQDTLYYNEEDIKSIVTKEQFESMKYKVVE